MKNLFRVMIFLAIGFQFIACGQAVPVTVTASPTPPPSVTQTATISATASPAATATIEVTPGPTYVRPTLIPTIDSVLLPELIKNAFSLQTFDLNGFNAQRITGWEYGFGTDIRYAYYYYCPKYAWLDKGHILLYPGTGQKRGPGDVGGYINVVPQPVIVNLEDETVWLPPVDTSSDFSCNDIYWSRELKILIITENNSDTPTVSTFTYDGEKLSSYPGKLLDISPKGTKILLTDYKVIDFITNKKIELNWNLVPYEYYWDFYWASDETRIYRCCYYYADLVSEKNFQFTESDFLDNQGNPIEYSGLSMYRGEWIQKNTYFLAEWSWGEDGDIRYLPMFDPATGTIFDVRSMAGISDEWSCYYTRVLPDDKYVWLAGMDGSYLIDLFTFEAQFYSDQDYFYVDYIDWSPNSNFIWIDRPQQEDEANKYNILSIAEKQARTLPISPLSKSEHLWHPTENIVVYPARDKNAFIFLDASTMSFRELSFKGQESQYTITNLAWSPNGDKLIFITEDHILWQVDYPSLENLEQIMASANTISGAEWSPDGNSIAFVNGSDIYIVDLAK